MFNNFLLKLHVGQPQVFSKEVRPFPYHLSNNQLQIGSFHVRPPFSFFNLGLNYIVHHPFRTTHTL